MSDRKQICVGYCDGHYWLEEWKLGQPIKCIEIAASEWECYQAFDKLAPYWHERCRSLSNDQYALEYPEARTEDVLGPEPDEDNLCREPVTGSTLIEAADVAVKNLTGAQIAGLEKLGWTFGMTGPNEWDWIKFRGDLSSQRAMVARGGDEIWARDVKAVCRV
jgi:hypothetical protein